MNVSLTPELERYISEKVESGLYRSQSEVVREGLRLLVERDRLLALRLERLREKVAVGLEEARAGELIPVDDVFADLAERGRQRRERGT